MKNYFRLISLSLSVCLGGCVGIAHNRVSTAPLEVQLKNTADVKVEVWHVPFYGERALLVALAGGEGIIEPTRHAWLIRENPPVIFPAESRYVGYPVFLPLTSLAAPDAEVGIVQRLLIRCDGRDTLIRLIAGSKGVAIAEVSLSATRAKLPELLKKPMPLPRDATWDAYHEQSSAFERSVTWQQSRKATAHFIPAKGNDRSVLKIEPKC